jgi:cold shock CspA family protein
VSVKTPAGAHGLSLPLDRGRSGDRASVLARACRPARLTRLPAIFEGDVMQKGRLKHWFADKGFGFITSDGADIFLHHSVIEGEPALGDTIEFEPAPDRKYPGKFRAVTARIIGHAP